MTQFSRYRQKGFTVIELLIAGFALLVISGVIALVCVGVHFIGKFW